MTDHDVRTAEPQTFGEHNGFEVYPMPMFALMETADVRGLTEWYRTALGFGVMFEMPPGPGGQPMLAHLRRRKYQDVLIRLGETRDAGAATALCFEAADEVDAIYAQAAAAAPVGRARVDAPVDQPWNVREVRIVDPEGRTLVFTQPRHDPEAMKRMQAIFDADKGG